MTLTARIPVNYPAVWAAALAIPILLDARGVVQRFRDLAARLRSISLPGWPERIAFALLAFVLCIHWFAALEPETSSDGLAMHLAIPANIAAHHAMTYRPELFLWSVMPMAADFSYAMVYLLGGEAAVSLFNFALLISIAALIYSANRRWLPRAPALVVTALFASTPLAYLVTGSLFIENFVAAMISGHAGGPMAIPRNRPPEPSLRRRRPRRRGRGRQTRSLRFRADGPTVRRHRSSPAMETSGRAAGRHGGAGDGPVCRRGGAALSHRLCKNRQSGLSLPNTRLPSPMVEHGLDFRDSRYHKPLAWTTPFNLTFHTGDYFEAQNGAFGFQYLLLIPLALIALLAAQRLRCPNRRKRGIGRGRHHHGDATQRALRVCRAASTSLWRSARCWRDSRVQQRWLPAHCWPPR